MVVGWPVARSVPITLPASIALSKLPPAWRTAGIFSAARTRLAISSPSQNTEATARLQPGKRHQHSAKKCRNRRKLPPNSPANVLIAPEYRRHRGCAGDRWCLSVTGGLGESGGCDSRLQNGAFGFGPWIQEQLTRFRVKDKNTSSPSRASRNCIASKSVF